MPSYAQSSLTLPVPEFTVKFVGESYNVPTTTSINPYTGLNETIPAHFVTNGTIIMSIKNNGSNSNFLNGFPLFYNVRMKGHFEADNWTSDVYNPYSGGSNSGGFQASDMDYTIQNYDANNYAPNSQIDFQVQAVVYNVTSVPFNPNYPNTSYYNVYTLYAISDWSATRTVTIGQSSPSPTPTVPEFPSWVILPILIMAIAFSLIVRKRKK